MHQAKAKLTDYVEDAVAYIGKVDSDDNAPPADRMKAAQFIAEHVLGKPRQAIDMDQCHTLSEEFESFSRKMNDRKNLENRALMDEALPPLVDFDKVETR